MKACPSCGSQVADEAVSCPKCGHQFGPNIRRMIFLAALLILLAMAVGLILKEAQINSAINQLGR